MMQLGEVETDFEKEIKEAFKFFDKDGDGEVGCPPVVVSVCPVLAVFFHVSELTLVFS